MISPFFKKKDSMDKQTKTGMVQKVQLSEEPWDEMEEPIQEETLAGLVTTGKAQLDKKSLDLIFSVEQIIQARQHAETNINELQDRLTHSSSHVERLNRDMKNLNKIIEEREKNVRDLEQKLIEKNLKVDQVLEDYRELQTSLSSEIEDLKSSIDLEQQKYVSLIQKNNEAHAEKLKKMNDLEEKLGRVEIENTHLRQKYETIRQEKAYLSGMISDFTNRMTVPFGNGNGNSLTERYDGNGDT